MHAAGLPAGLGANAAWVRESVTMSKADSVLSCLVLSQPRLPARVSVSLSVAFAAGLAGAVALAIAGLAAAQWGEGEGESPHGHLLDFARAHATCSRRSLAQQMARKVLGRRSRVLQNTVSDRLSQVCREESSHE